MDTTLIISIFITLFIAVDPFGLIPVFVVFISKYDPSKQKRVIYKTIITALIVSIFFIFLGRFILFYLRISPGAFLISGGILLFLISMDLILARPSRAKTMYDSSELEKDDFGLLASMIKLPST